MSPPLTLTEVQEAALGPRKGWKSKDWDKAQAIANELLNRRAEGFEPVRVERGAVVFGPIDSPPLPPDVEPMFKRARLRIDARREEPTPEQDRRYRCWMRNEGIYTPRLPTAIEWALLGLVVMVIVGWAGWMMVF